VSQPRSILLLAATRPIVPLLVGYLSVSTLLALMIAVQSGPAVAFSSGLANAVILSPAMGLAWILGRVLERRALPEQPWWVTRAQGHMAGFVAALSLAAIPLAAIAEQMRGAPEAATMSWEQLVAVLVFGLAFVNGAPLVIAFGVEAFARRRHPPAKVTPRRAP
jgi:hypothetical protein